MKVDDLIVINNVPFKAPLMLIWKPKENITTFELAMSFPIMMGYRMIYEDSEELKESYFRHFEITNPNKRNKE